MRWWLLAALLAASSALASRASAAPEGPDAGAGTERRDGAADTVDGGAAPPQAVSDGDHAPAPAAAPTEVAPGGVLLRGRVLEKGTRHPLAGATLVVDAAPAGETDAAGGFALLLPAGPHRVQAQFPGHELADRRVEVTAGMGEVLFRLPPLDDGERYETTVHGGRPELQQVDLSASEARKTAGTSGDPLRVIGSLPGVAQIFWPAAIYVVRGANPGNTGFFLDGLRVPALFHLALGPSVIHPYLIGGLEFFPGSYPATYGGYASGIVAARTSPGPTDRVHASVDVTVYDAGGIATAPFDQGRGAVVAAARYSYTGALLSALSENTVLRYGDYQLRVDHPLAGGQATVFAFGSLDELGGAFSSAGLTDYGALQFHRVDLRWRGALAGGQLRVATAVGADWARSTLFQRPIRVRALSSAPRIAYDRPLGARADLQVGADAELQDFVTEVPAFQRRQSDLAHSRGALASGLFATVALRAGPRLVIAPGLRAGLFAEQDVRRFALEPRLDVLVRPAPAVALRASAGRFAQMPSLPVSVPGFEAFGLADLGLQTSSAVALGADLQLPGALTAGVTGYYQSLRLTDVRDPTIDPTAIDPTGPDYLVARRGRSYGAEILVRRTEQRRFYGWLAYTLSWSLREDDNGVLGRSDWDERHILNLVAGWRLGHGYTVGARVHYNTGRPAPVFASNGQYRELPAFYQLDVRAERRFVFNRFLLDVYVDVANATLTRETVQLVNDIDPMTGDRFLRQGSFQLFLPTIGLHAEL